MSFGNILGQLLEQVISGQSQTQAHIGTSAHNITQGGQGFEQILGSLQSMLGGAMAILSTLALAAAQNARGGGQTAPSSHLAAGAAPSQADVAAVASEEGERLALRAMIAAAEADGQIDQDEMHRTRRLVLGLDRDEALCTEASLDHAALDPIDVDRHTLRALEAHHGEVLAEPEGRETVQARIRQVDAATHQLGRLTQWHPPLDADVGHTRHEARTPDVRTQIEERLAVGVAEEEQRARRDTVLDTVD